VSQVHIKSSSLKKVQNDTLQIVLSAVNMGPYHMTLQDRWCLKSTFTYATSGYPSDMNIHATLSPGRVFELLACKTKTHGNAANVHTQQERKIEKEIYIQ